MIEQQVSPIDDVKAISTVVDEKDTATHDASEHGDPSYSSLRIEAVANTDPESSENSELEHIKSLVKKLDRTLMPIVILMVIFKILDITIIGAAKVNGIEKDLHLRGNQYSTTVAITQVGYMVTQIPSNMLITRIRPSIYLSCCCLLWSVVGACHAVARSFGGLLAARFLLGIIDAPFHVGILHLLSSWYSQREMALRGSFLIGSIVIVMAFIGPISAGIFAGLGGKLGATGWRWIYILLGTLGFVIGCFGFVFIPDYPDSGRQGFFLTLSERKAAAERSMTERVNASDDSRRALKHAFVDAIQDKRTWIFSLLFLARNSTAGLMGFYAEIITALDVAGSRHNSTIGLLLTSPPAVFAVMVSFVVSWSSDRRNERTFHNIVPTLLVLIGFTMSAASVNTVVRYISAFMYVAGMVASAPIAMSWQVNVINETPEKKACVIAITTVLSGFGGIWSPYFFRRADQPRYLLAFILMAVWMLVDIACCLWLRQVLVKMNEALKKAEDELRATSRPDRGETKYYIL